MNTADPNEQLARYRGWFYAAALYNLIWGSVNVLFPNLFFDILGMARPNYAPLWQVVGMLILVYAPAYWWAARYPFHHRHLILIAIIGKLLGPLGFVWAVWSGSLPLVFGWTILTNDLIWWPAFFLYLRDVIRLNGGLWSYLSGR